MRKIKAYASPEYKIEEFFQEIRFVLFAKKICPFSNISKKFSKKSEISFFNAQFFLLEKTRPENLGSPRGLSF